MREHEQMPIDKEEERGRSERAACLLLCCQAEGLISAPSRPLLVSDVEVVCEDEVGTIGGIGQGQQLLRAERSHAS